MCHESGVPRFLLDLREGAPATRSRTRCWSRGSNASSASSIGRRPSAGAITAEAVLPSQFDAWVWFDETRAVTPLGGAQRPAEPHVLSGEDDTYPFGL